MSVRGWLTIVLVVSCGCSRAVESEQDVVEQASHGSVSLPAGWVSLVINVPDIMCEDSCPKATHDVLAAQPGVEQVDGG